MTLSGSGETPGTVTLSEAQRVALGSFLHRVLTDWTGVEQDRAVRIIHDILDHRLTDGTDVGEAWIHLRASLIVWPEAISLRPAAPPTGASPNDR